MSGCGRALGPQSSEFEVTKTLPSVVASPSVVPSSTLVVSPSSSSLQLTKVNSPVRKLTWRHVPDTGLSRVQPAKRLMSMGAAALSFHSVTNLKQ